MATPAELQARVREFDWDGLRELWASIQAGTTGWEKGDALEYLIIRAFEIDPMEPARVRYPYEVSLQKETVEEIDGAVHLVGLSCLIESKDHSGDVPFGPVAKMRNQLLRRPAGTIGAVFAKNSFTEPARILARFNMPQTILLWRGTDIQTAMDAGKITEFLRLKYRECCETGIVDLDLRERESP